MDNNIQYSGVLQDFAEPLFDGSEPQDAILQKLKVAELIWNHCIAEEYQLPVFAALDKAIRESNVMHPEMKIAFYLMRELKKAEFSEYKNFILKTEYRIKPDGSKSIYVESVAPEIFKSIYEQIGIKK